MSTPAKKICLKNLKLGEEDDPEIDISDRSKYEKHFLIIYNAETKLRTAKCRLCSKIYKMSNGNTSGISNHLETKHPIEFSESNKKTPSSSKTEGKITDADHVEWTASKYLPFNFFDDSLTQEYFHKLNKDVNLPYRKNLKSLTLERYEVLKKRVMEVLKKNPSRIAFTTDAWSGGGKSYYGITAHYLDQNWEMQSVTLDFIPSKGKHSGLDIANIFYISLKDHDLEDKIIGVTVDNVSANTRFVQELAKILPNFHPVDMHFRCVAHILNLAVQDLLKELKLKPVSKRNENLVVDEEDDDSDFEEDEDEEENENEQEIHDFSNPLAKIRSLSSKIRLSELLKIDLENACKLKKIEYLNPILDCKTRWNSCFDMMERGIYLKGALNILCKENPKLREFLLSEKEWSLIEEVTKFLGYFKQMSDLLSGNKYVTLPIVVVSFNVLLDKVESVISDLRKKKNKSEVEENMFKGCEAAFRKMIKHYSKTNWVYCVVLILDPRHKLETFNATEWGKALLKESERKFREIFQKYENKYFETHGHPEINAVQVNVINTLQKKKTVDENKLDFNYLYRKPLQNQDLAKKNELNHYLDLPREEEKTEILEYWKSNESKFPILSSMARDYLAIQATSVASEQLFSKAALFLKKTRNRLSPESIQSQLCINSWRLNSSLYEGHSHFTLHFSNEKCPQQNVNSK